MDLDLSALESGRKTAGRSSQFNPRLKPRARPVSGRSAGESLLFACGAPRKTVPCTSEDHLVTCRGVPNQDRNHRRAQNPARQLQVRAGLCLGNDAASPHWDPRNNLSKYLVPLQMTSGRSQDLSSNSRYRTNQQRLRARTPPRQLRRSSLLSPACSRHLGRQNSQQSRAAVLRHRQHKCLTLSGQGTMAKLQCHPLTDGYITSRALILVMCCLSRSTCTHDPANHTACA